MEEKTYTIHEAQEYLGIQGSGRGNKDIKDIYKLFNTGEIKCWKEKEKGHKWLTNKENLDAYLTTQGKAPLTNGVVKVQGVREELAPLPVQVVEAKPVEQPNDGKLLQDILSATFAFLAEHSFPIGMKSFEEVKADFRHWIFKTQETTLDIVASNGQITVLAEKYQKELEEKLALLTEQLKKAETTLSLLRQKKREVFLPYAYSLPVWVEQRHEGVLVWCGLFPFSALGKDEQEALAAFKRTLKGYCWQLRTHEKELTPELRAQFETLKELLVEDD